MEIFPKNSPWNRRYPVGEVARARGLFVSGNTRWDVVEQKKDGGRSGRKK